MIQKIPEYLGMPVFKKKLKLKSTYKRFCKVCRSRTIHNLTKDLGLVCSRCGIKTSEENLTLWSEKLGISMIQRFK